MPRPKPRRGSRLRLRLAAFLGLALLIVGLAFTLGRPKELAFIEIGPGAAPPASAAGSHAMAEATMAPGGAQADLTVRIDMGGFTPPDLDVPAGRATRLAIVNPDNSHHTDGGGVHQLAIPDLGVDVKVPPLTNMVVALPAADPGEYVFWCDTCCGGKENPSMRGVLRVRA